MWSCYYGHYTTPTGYLDTGLIFARAMALKLSREIDVKDLFPVRVSTNTNPHLRGQGWYSQSSNSKDKAAIILDGCSTLWIVYRPTNGTVKNGMSKVSLNTSSVWCQNATTCMWYLIAIRTTVPMLQLCPQGVANQSGSTDWHWMHLAHHNQWCLQCQRIKNSWATSYAQSSKEEF